MSRQTFDVKYDTSGPVRIAAELLEERVSQVIKHGYTKSHDDDHENGELAMAAALYASPVDNLCMVETDNEELITKDPWPFWMASPGTPHSDRHGDKRATLNKRERLVIAGSLILAEIERLDRESGNVPKSQPNIPELERRNIRRILEVMGDSPFGASKVQRTLEIGYSNAARSIERGLNEGVLVVSDAARMLVKKAP